MKKILLLISSVFLIALHSQAQQVPSGMKYQAVARDNRGEVLANQTISLRINLTSKASKGRSVHYSEVQEAKTNELGLFTLVIGEGQALNGRFTDVPWATQDIWMEIAIKERGQGGFTLISDSKLLAVPYAFHAGTASQLVGNNMKGAKTDAGIPASAWSLKGNSNSDPSTDKLGTTDFADLVLVTNNIERLRIKSNGDIDIAKSLALGEDLYVKRNVFLNTEGGATINNGDFTVEKESATKLTGTLNVDGATDLNNTLSVNNESATKLTGTLKVDGATDLNNTLSVNNESATKLTGTLTVDKATDLKSTLNADGAAKLNSTLTVEGASVLKSTLDVKDDATLESDLNVNGATDLDGSLNVDGIARFRETVSFDKNISIEGAMKSASLEITDNTTGHLATFSNTNTGDGDGVLIKLGKTHPRWNGSAYVNVTNPGVQGLETQINQIRSWIYGDDTFSTDDLINLAPSQYLAGTICNLTNYVTEKINSSLNLPYKIGPYSTPSLHIWDAKTIFGGLDLGALGEIPKLEIPALTVPSAQVLPEVTAMPKIPKLSCGSLPTLSWPVLNFTSVSNSLTKKNEFITFADKDGRVLGAIRAQSIQDFSTDYFDGVELINIASQVIGIDLLKDAMGVIASVSQMTADYNNIGVEYSSGNGDYAEWLERLDPNEIISTGDIVAVKGGKITKDLKGAEQIMAVSHRPIVLGNVPEKSKLGQGNTIAFMGQIPVKVMGAVAAGDYIVARGPIAGYGVAVHPQHMSVEDFQLSVGRSWDTNAKPGPKMVNTVVGVHNHDFLDIISRMQQNLQSSERRLDAIERHLNIEADNSYTPKKPVR
ncbi:MAG: hypothetical protein ACO1OO_13305 [Flavisolibacter sp.]